MKTSFLLWIDYHFLHFGIAKCLQEKSNCDMSAIISVNNNIKKFFRNQRMVQFQKVWYYDDNKNITPNLEYLKSVEIKYNLNLWEIAFVDRAFYSKYNKYYQFKHDEILSLLEHGCRFFEEILKEIKPDFVLMHAITSYHHYLFYKICKYNQIKVLTLEPVRFGDRWMISKGVYNQDETKNRLYKSTANRTSEELQNYLKSHKPAKFLFDESFNNYKVSKWEKFKAATRFLFISNPEDQVNQYANYGRTKLKILTKGTAKAHLLKTKLRESFINKNFTRKIDEKISFFYFPLHEEPEKTILMGAPYYTDQLAVITNIAKSMPVGYRLYVKEHPVMKRNGWRSKSFYKQIMDLPNVTLVHPSLKQEDVIKKCSLVITIRGTAAIEAAIYQKPAIVFAADYGWSLIPSIHIIKQIEELSQAIRSSLQKNVSASDLNEYMDFIENESFEYPHHRYSTDVVNKFKYNIGYLKSVNISESEMIKFLEEHKQLFEHITKEYLRKTTSQEQ